MANMRTTYSATVTMSAVQLKPTQITARQAACIRRNGMTRAQSICLPESRGVAGSIDRVAKSLLPNQRDSSLPTRSAVGGSTTISFSGVISFPMDCVVVASTWDQRAAEAANRRKHQQAAQAAPRQMHAEYPLDDENT